MKFLSGFQDANGDVEVAIQFGDFLYHPESAAQSFVERLDLENNLRLFALVGGRDLVAKTLRA